MARKNKNSFDKQLDESKEYKNNAHKPGHFTGTGRSALAMKNSFKGPKIMFFIGIIFLFPVTYNIITDFSIKSIISCIIPLFIGIAMIYGGIRKIIKKKK